LSKEKKFKVHYWLEKEYPYNVLRFNTMEQDEVFGKAFDKYKPFFSEKKHSKTNLSESTYRVLNHWEKLGLIDQRPDGKGWRKYAILDFVWLDIAHQLRRFGYPNEKIKKAYDKLSEDGRIPVAKQFFFNYYSTLVLFDIPVYVVVFEDGDIDFGTFQELKFTTRMGHLKNHIQIFLNPLILKFLKLKEPYNPDRLKLSSLSKDENQVIDNLRSGNYESVKIKMKDGKINLIESEELVNSKNKIIDLLKEGNFQDIELKQRDGNIVSIKRTIKMKTM